jgi:hypothetical protein
MPVPPSVDEPEPMPSTSRETPCARASAIASPKPRVCASKARGRGGVPRSSMPLVFVSSTTAVPRGASGVGGSSTHDASTGSSSGPVTVTGMRCAPGTAAAKASTVPSPPSAIGMSRRSLSVRSRRHPVASASAAAAAPIVPLNESGAITTLWAMTSRAGCGGGAVAGAHQVDRCRNPGGLAEGSPDVAI